MKKIQKGFTLIELMIVVAIIGILAAVAIPAYQDYIVKSKLSKVVSTMDPIKTALALYLQEQGGFPVAAATDTVINGSAAQGPGVATTPGTFWASLGFSVLPSLPPEVQQMAPYTNTAATTSTNVTLILELNNIKSGTINGAYLALSPNTKGNAAISTTTNISPTGPATSDAVATDTVTGTSALQWYYGCALAGDAALGFNAPKGPDSVLTNFFKNANVPIICR